MAARSGGSGSYLSVAAANGGSVMTTAARWTVGAWAKASSAMVNLNGIVVAQFASADANFFLGVSYSSNGLTPAGRYFVGTYDDSASDWDFAIDTVTHEIGQWVHLVGMYDSVAAELRLYKNGKFVSSGTVAGYGSTSQPVRVGMRSSNTTDYFDGAIADAFFYTEPLTPDEVLRIYQGAPPPTIRPQSLKAYWPLRGGALQQDNASPNVAHLSMTGSVTVEEGPPTLQPPLLGAFEFAQSFGPLVIRVPVVSA